MASRHNFSKLNEVYVKVGCPISALLFILVAAILAINLHNNKGITGLTFNNHTVTITQLADDATLLFLKDGKSLDCTIEIFNHFQREQSIQEHLKEKVKKYS